MNIANLPFDAAAILAGVKPWVACESPSWDAAAVSRMAMLAATDLREAGADIRLIPGEDGYGDCVFADFDPLDPRPGVLVLGHLDTVHPLGGFSTTIPWREQDGRCHGPGLFDMKAGNFLALEATRQLRGAGILRRLPLRFLLTSDEESGSPSTRGLIEHTAAGSKYVLVPEGAQPNGNLVSGRFPTTRFRLRTSGKPAHALLQRAEGRSALAAMAGLIARIEAMNSADCSFTVTYFKSGHRVATVPMHGDAEVICTARSQEALDGALEALKNLAHENSDTVLDVDIKTARPTWVPGPGDHAMWNLARTLSEAIGIALDRETLFGGSDGNFTGAMGIPTLDGLGPIGADAHQITENIDIASLVPRGRLLAGLIALLE